MATLQHLHGLLAIALTRSHGAVGRPDIGRPRSVLPDQSLHGPRSGGGRQRIARRLRLERQAERSDGLDDPRSKIRRACLDQRQVAYGLQHHRALRDKSVDPVLQRDHRHILWQRRSMGGQPPDFLGFAFPVSGGITLRRDQRMEPTFGIGRQVRRSGELLEALAASPSWVSTGRRAAPAAARCSLRPGPECAPARLPVRPSPWRAPSQLPARRAVRRRVPRLHTVPTPGIDGIGNVTPAAAVADQRLCLVVKPRQRRTKVEQASAGDKLSDLAAKPQEFAATFAQASLPRPKPRSNNHGWHRPESAAGIVRNRLVAGIA